jgi:hypothetical protein
VKFIHKRVVLLACAGFVLLIPPQMAHADAAKKISANQCVERHNTRTSMTGVSWEVKNICAESIRVVLCYTAAPKDGFVIGKATCSITLLDANETKTGSTPISSHSGDWLYATTGSCFLSMGNDACYKLAVDMKNKYEGKE